MKALCSKYLNEIVGLTIMVLMTVALVAGEADAQVKKMRAEDPREVIEIRLTISP